MKIFSKMDKDVRKRQYFRLILFQMLDLSVSIIGFLFGYYGMNVAIIIRDIMIEGSEKRTNKRKSEKDE